MTVLVSFNFPTEKLVIPHKFDRLLEVLSKEILKEQPKNIYEFCSDFFKEELSIRNELFEEEKRLRDVTGGTSKPPTPSTPSSSGPDGSTSRGNSRGSSRTKSGRCSIAEEIHNEILLELEHAKQNVETLKKEWPKTPTTSSVSTPSPVVDIDLNDADVNKAATLIGATFRGHQTRKSLTSLKANSSSGVPSGSEDSKETENQTGQGDSDPHTEQAKAVPEVPTASEAEEKAATIISSTFRGHMVRKNSTNVVTHRVDDLDPAEMKIATPHIGRTIEEEEEEEEEEVVEKNDGAEEVKRDQEKEAIEPKNESIPLEENRDSSSEKIENKEDKEVVDIDLNSAEVNMAATKIGAVFRGHQTRKQMAEKKEESN